MLKWELCSSLVGHENVLKAKFKLPIDRCITLSGCFSAHCEKLSETSVDEKTWWMFWCLAGCVKSLPQLSMSTFSPGLRIRQVLSGRQSRYQRICTGIYRKTKETERQKCCFSSELSPSKYGDLSVVALIVCGPDVVRSVLVTTTTTTTATTIKFIKFLLPPSQILELATVEGSILFKRGKSLWPAKNAGTGITK